MPPAMPKSLLVIGSGAIGIEFASFYLNMGAQGHGRRSAAAHPAGRGRGNFSAFAHKAFEKQGMKILTGAAVKGAKKAADSVTVTVEAGGKSQDITVDRVISAVGIVGNVEGIGLEGTGGQSRSHPCRDRRITAAPASRASTPSAISPARPGSRTRPATRA